MTGKTENMANTFKTSWFGVGKGRRLSKGAA